MRPALIIALAWVYAVALLMALYLVVTMPCAPTFALFSGCVAAAIALAAAAYADRKETP